MAKKIVKAIVMVEIDEEEERLGRISCKLENGTSMILNREQVFIPLLSDSWTDTKNQPENLPVTC
jgi:hypothetical protein